MTNLTKEQRQAVTTIDGNIEVLSVAGSGKTHSFVTRIAYMISKGIEPENILAVTFTKKATEEMESRLKKLVGADNVSRLMIGTFHSIAMRTLIKNNMLSRKVIPEWEKFNILNDIVKDYDKENNHNGMSLGIPAVELASFISMQKASLIESNMEDLKEHINLQNVSEASLETVSRKDWALAYKKYEELKKSKRLIDFDDILLMFHNNLKNNKSFRERIQNQFDYVMIDEGQDTSFINMEIIKMINQRNVCIVGDFRQSIYSFMNADVKNMLNFQNQFKNVELIEMNINFRSTQKIVNFSNRIIANAKNDEYDKYKQAESANEVGDDVKLHIFSNEQRQYDNVVSKIIATHSEKGVNFDEMAVLVRTNSEMAFLETLLNDFDIPYEVSKQGSFFERKEIIDLLSYADIVVNNDNDTAFRRIINAPSRFIRKITIEGLDKNSNQHNCNLMNSVKYTDMRSSERNKLSSLLQLINDYSDKDIKADKFLREIIYKTGYMAFLEKNARTATALEDKKKAIENLLKIASRFSTVEDFTKYIQVMQIKMKDNKGKETLKISTIHSSKGLEWDYVYVVSADEVTLPHEMCSDYEEERRLFYVACSRPRKELHLCYPMFREGQMLKASPFIMEMFESEKVFKEATKPILRGEVRELELNI